MMDGYSSFRAFLKTRWGIGFVAFVATAAVLLIFDHWTHIVDSNLYLSALLLVCAGMHFFMHGGHGGHGGSGKGEN